MGMIQKYCSEPADWSVANSLDLHLGSAQFESQLSPAYPDWGFLWFSSVLAYKCQVSTLIRPDLFIPVHLSATV
jgi:hypothetical protein